MAQNYKILGQLSPSATTLTDIYTVPASTSSIISSMIICNRSATPTAFRISVAFEGDANDVKQYLYYDTPIAGNDTFAATLGLSLSETDVIRVYATLATLSFNVSGVEIA